MNASFCVYYKTPVNNRIDYIKPSLKVHYAGYLSICKQITKDKVILRVQTSLLLRKNRLLLKVMPVQLATHPPNGIITPINHFALNTVS